MSRDFHPELQRALDAMELPEVQEMLERLGQFGLAISLPHQHGPNGEFQPLERDKIAFEKDLKVSFLDAADPVLVDTVAVSWRWDGEKKQAAACNRCTLVRRHRNLCI